MDHESTPRGSSTKMISIAADLTDKDAAEIAAKFDTTVEEVHRRHEMIRTQGVDSAMADFEAGMAKEEQAVLEVVDDVAIRYLDQPNRHWAMAEFYREGWEAMSAEEITTASVGDLFLNLAVAIYLLAETRQQLAIVMDGQHRRGS